MPIRLQASFNQLDCQNIKRSKPSYLQEYQGYLR